MKTLVLVALSLLSAGSAAAQTPPSQNAAAPHGVVVLEHGWHTQAAYNPALFEDPLRVAEEQARMDSVRNEVIQLNKIRVQAGVEQVPVPTGGGMTSASNRGVRSNNRSHYVYDVKLTNTGTKKIRSLDWEYVLVDSSTGTVAGRRQFTSKVGLRPGQKKKLSGRSTLPPSLTVDASQGRDARFKEKVVIRRVEFEDGAVWQNPADPDTDTL
ncbi:MAG TPA: hypothetical protein VF668_14175 [Pyrinomonadaceae bacterium]|jgi:hypothetical protein